jgi:hypothetical protein
MPYISRKDRQRAERCPETAGELNYAITVLIDNYIREKGVSYALLNEVMGVLACVGQELYRRIIVPYEKEKCVANGEVYTCFPRKER